MKVQIRIFVVSLVGFIFTQMPTWSQTTLADSFPWFTKSARIPSFPDLALAPDRLTRALKDRKIVPVDLRSASAFQAGHIPGAVNMQLPGDHDLVAIRVALATRGICKDRAVVLYGEDSNLLRVGSAFLDFEASGFSATTFLLGGFDSWSASHGQIEVQTSEYPPCPPENDSQREVFVDRQWVADHFDQPNVEILDLRGPGGWSSGDYSPPPLFGAGHIPHSLPLDVAALLNDHGEWPQAAAARSSLGRLGPRPQSFVNLDGTFVLYGTGADDPRFGMAYLLLRALDVNVKVFAAGYQGWVEDMTSPVVRIRSTKEIMEILAIAGRRGKAAPIIFDLREDWDFRAGHLPGAESLPSREFAAQLEARVVEQGRSIDRSQTPLILYCYGLDCIRSRDCAVIAARHGFVNLLWYREGMDGWVRKGNETASESDKSRITAEIYEALARVTKEQKPSPP